MNYFYIFFVSIIPFLIPKTEEEKIGKVELYLEGEGTHKFEILNTYNRFDTIFIDIHVECDKASIKI